ncbi:MAG: fumarylacetoacetate hydrolase family protein [Candidatus Kaelpia aquatica]|nr:fumarylacetoacetate hydrolase family protein [Candidatus Kaelpia aquatica]
MKITRVFYENREYWAKIEESSVTLLKDPPFDKINPLKDLSFTDVKLLIPTEPQKIVLAGLNYRDHARELDMKIPDEPIIFLKPPSSLIKDGDSIVYPKGVKRLDYEAELAVVIRREAKDIKESEVADYILGYSCLNDVTARDIQSRDIQWSRAKSFDSFAPFGPWIETDLELDNLRVKSYLNSELKQDSSISNFIFSLPELLAFISSIMTLKPGDIVSTGTPSGVGSMEVGDKVSVEIDGIGVLSNTVISC